MDLKRAGAEPASSQLLLSKHTQCSQEQHVIQPVSQSVRQEGPCGGATRGPKRTEKWRGSQIRRVPRSFNVMLYYFLSSWRQKVVLVYVCAMYLYRDEITQVSSKNIDKLYEHDIMHLICMIFQLSFDFGTCNLLHR